MALRTVTLGASRLLSYKAAVDGGSTAILSGDCSAPIDRELRGAGSPLLKQLGELSEADWYATSDHYPVYRYVPGMEPRGAPPATQTVYVRLRCRKCPECLEQRRRQWTAKAIVETRQSSRTWFGTLTVGPDRRFWAKACAERFVAKARNEPFGMLTPVERTREIARHLQPEVTRYLKRVRKAARVRFRYLLVVEPHGDGFPHFHLLLHERGQPVTKRMLDDQWHWGFSKWKLIPNEEVRAVGYVCKYVSKSAQARIRASQHYGQADKALLTEAVADALQAVLCSGKKLAVPANKW